jgi:DNA mismatch endonuclease Vsr
MPTRSRTRKPLTRSEIMSRIRRRDTLPEMRLRTSLHAAGLRYGVDHSIEGVHADVVSTKCRVAVFVDGCFWHACPRVINTANLAELAGTVQHALDEMDKIRFVELSDVNVSYGG